MKTKTEYRVLTCRSARHCMQFLTAGGPPPTAPYCYHGANSQYAYQLFRRTTTTTLECLLPTPIIRILHYIHFLLFKPEWCLYDHHTSHDACLGINFLSFRNEFLSTVITITKCVASTPPIRILWPYQNEEGGRIGFCIHDYPPAPPDTHDTAPC